MITTDFILIDYDYFDFEGRNYAKIFGRDGNGKRVCVIDSCPVYLWAIIKDRLKKGKINKENCQKCGESKTQAHHEDYSKLLDIMWLCSKHHAERHIKIDEMIDGQVEKMRLEEN